MSKPIPQQARNKDTSQYIDNDSYDPDYKVKAVEVLVENENENALERQKPIATEAKQDAQLTELQKMVGFEIPAYDYISLTYVASGNGVGEIETVTYKTGGSSGTTVATLTLGYDADNNLISITKS